MRRGLVASTPISGCPIRMFARGILVVARRGNLPRVKGAGGGFYGLVQPAPLLS
jgi:hypothetical protein